jgi:hypothetical protein
LNFSPWTARHLFEPQIDIAYLMLSAQSPGSRKACTTNRDSPNAIIATVTVDEFLRAGQTRFSVSGVASVIPALSWSARGPPFGDPRAATFIEELQVDVLGFMVRKHRMADEVPRSLREAQFRQALSNR